MEPTSGLMRELKEMSAKFLRQSDTYQTFDKGQVGWLSSSLLQ